MYIFHRMHNINNSNKMNKMDNNIPSKTFTFVKHKPLYALISHKNEVFMIGKKIEMFIAKRNYNTSSLEILKEHKPFNVIEIDKEKSFIKEANH